MRKNTAQTIEQSSIELREYRSEDLWLTRALECDPAIMKDLGGPTPADRIAAIHERRLRSVLNEEIWYYTICLKPESQPIGTIGIWESSWSGENMDEMGWMLLADFHGKGLAKTAGKLILERARIAGRYKEIHAFPALKNGPSNALCMKLGFTLLGEVSASYNGPPQPANHWKINLR